MIMIKAKEYIEFKKEDIIENLNSLYDEKETQEIFNNLGGKLTEITEFRHSETMTKKIIDKLIHHKLTKNSSILHWLIKAVENDDTYCHAYNYLAQYYNRKNLSLFEYQIKNISDPELFELIKKEQVSDKESNAEKEVKNNIGTSNIKNDETELSEKIKEHFAFFLGNCPRRGIPILSSENDFNRLIEWTTYFYENNFEVPNIDAPIQNINTNNYYTQLAFVYLFDQLRKLGFHSQRTRAKTIFNLWEKSFQDYSGYSEKNFWKVNQEKGNEVKKLMHIDY